MSINFSTAFNEFLPEGKLCDAAIRVRDAEFKVHRIVLSGCSSYFRDLFLSAASTPEQQVYTFPDVSSNTMSLVLRYAYTGAIVVTQENVMDLCAAAERFAVRDVQQVCCSFLEQHLDFKTCIDVWKLANAHSLPELRQTARLYILHHFEEVAGHSASFLQLSAEQLAEFMEEDELGVRQESSLFQIILRWINYAAEERRGHMALLLSKVRLLLVPIEYLIGTMSKDVLVSNSPPCLAMICSAVDALRGSPVGRPVARTRLPPAVLLAVSSQQSYNHSSQMEVYDVRADRWVTVNIRRRFSREFPGCVCLGGFIFFIGGFGAGSYLSSVEKLELVTQTWREVGPMHAARCFASPIVLDGCIYVMGGRGPRGPLNTAERYEPDANQWTLIASMHERRRAASAAALNGKVYICGGHNGEEHLRSAECYDPATNQWTLIASMETRCSGAGAVAHANHIYVAGGYDGSEELRDVTVYDPWSNLWRRAAPMARPRSNFGMAVLEEQLFVAGGLNDHGLVRHVERYDAGSNAWLAARDMNALQGFIGCCVVERNPHAAAYVS